MDKLISLGLALAFIGAAFVVIQSALTGLIFFYGSEVNKRGPMNKKPILLFVLGVALFMSLGWLQRELIVNVLITPWF